MRAHRALFYIFVALVLPLSACECEDTSGENNSSPNNQLPDAGEDTNNREECDACRDDQVCTDQADGAAECVCPAGASEVDGACVTDTSCMPSTCNAHGSCMDGDDGPECACELGWVGDFCETCDEVNGWTADGRGGCTDDLCSTLDCAERVCVIEDGAPQCACPAGTHDDGSGGCEADLECGPTTCNMQGTCDDTGDVPQCTCNEGWQQPNCQVCDDALGWHDDGAGGCTMDPCLPNPCMAANQSACVADGTNFTCECDPDYHLDQGVCVEDEVCDAASCSMHGTCDHTGGVIGCVCDAGYAGADCAACDVAAGYHDDGAGGCTMDACLPNPCTVTPNKAVCVAGPSGGTMCACDVGYHDDGLGGCTTDPCLPDLCAASNQACRVTNGAAECFTPVCDDQNDCTDDTLVNGVCQYTDRVDGSTCSTGACTTAQVCTTGVCGGGSPLVCDDQNDCTDDSCDAATGCVFANDNTNLPDDGIPCTDDVCTDGFASNTNNNANCDDALFCNGVEVCAPSDAAADADGCIITNVPTAPASPGPCAAWGACDEAQDDFPLVVLNPGDPCNDGIWCTTGDVCDATGACAGTPGDCGGPASTECTSTTPMPVTIDLPTATLTTNVTMNGQPLSGIIGNESTSNNIYAVDVNTGTRHSLAYWDWYGGPFDIVYGERLIAGVYDIVFVRGTTSSTETYVYRTDSTDLVPNGVKILQTNVLIAAGPQTLNIDIPVATLTTSVTMDGLDLSTITANESTSNNIYAVSESGTRHSLAYWDWYGGTFDSTYGDRIIPGVYDIIFVRGTTSSTEKYVYRTDTSDTVPNGVTYLHRNFTIGAGNVSLDFDIPTTAMTTHVTMDGQPLSGITANESTSNNIYAVSETGTRHSLAYWDWYGGPFDITYGDRLIEGTYDIIFVRGTTSSTEKYVYRTDTSDVVPNGVVYLQRGVVISGATQTLDVDIPIATLSPTVTYNGQPLSSITANESTNNNIYAISKSTGTRHSIAHWDWYGGTLDVTFADRLIADTYDIIFVRGTTSSTETYVYRTVPVDVHPNAVIYLERDKVIPAGNVALGFDLQSTNITTNVTLDGMDLSTVTGNESTSNNIYAVSRDTGTRHSLAYWDWYGGVFDIDYGDRLVPGTYDLIFVRGTTSSTEKYVYRTVGSDVIPNAVVVLATEVVVPAGSHTFDINLETVARATQVTADGLPVDQIVANESTSNNLYAVHRETGTRHSLAYWDWYGGVHDFAIGERFFANTYDVIYVRGTTSSTEKYVYRTVGSDVHPNGVTYVGRCMTLP